MKPEPIATNEYTHLAHTIRFDWYPDDTTDTPWERADGYGPVTDWERRDKGAGERILHSDGGSKRFYDFTGAVKIARRDGWGISEADTAKLATRLGRTPTPGDVVAEAVERDYKWLKDWCDDKWHYIGYQVTITDPEGTELNYQDGSLWGIDSLSMEQFEEEEIEAIHAWLDARAVAAVKESDEAHLMACRDIATA